MFLYNRACILAAFIFFTSFIVKSQTPSSCFEIESILVDACGSPESDNEMVRFVVGPNDLNYNNMNVNWPTTSNSYDGICKNSTTASKVAALNNTIVGCGLILEPSGNILPSGSTVILFTSTLFDISANSFANLNDTIYAIFQCPGNTLGHFSNSSSSLKTLTISFSSPSSCSDVVTYLPTDLIGGDGATVEYTWSGISSYTNNGCTAPIVINTLTINESGISICPGDTIDLSATIQGSFNSTNWSGGNGSFSSLSNQSTTYYSNNLDLNDFYIFFEGITNCGASITDSILIQINTNNSSVSISSTTTELCNGDSILLSAIGTGNYLWNTGETTSSIYVSSSGIYNVTSSSSCGSAQDSITITDSPLLSLSLTASDTLICNGSNATLTANGGTNYLWFNNSTASSVSVNSSGNYYVIGTNNCYSDSISITINVVNSPSINISSSSSSNTICPNSQILITATGSNNYLWSTGDTSSSILINTAGIYTVFSSNQCGTDSVSLTINSENLPSSSIIGDTIICNNSIQLTAVGNGDFLWSTGSTNSTELFNTQETIFLVVTNECGTDTTFKNIINQSIVSSFSSDYQNNNELPSLVNFTNLSSLNSINYEWSFGNGLTSNELNPSTTYSESGEYIISLTSSNAFCENTYYDTITFERPNTIYIPNVFTPNNDLTNDYFMVKGENIKSFECKIFNRWGEELHTLNNIKDSWDGTYNGKQSSDGTYFYIINLLWNNDTKETFTGHITLLR